MEEGITPIGTTNYQNEIKQFGIKDHDRFGHLYAIGKTGVGKSTLLLNMAISDIERGNGICVIDPHGDLAAELLKYIPDHRIQDVIYFNPKDLDYPIPFNPLKGVHPNYHHLVTSGIISTMKKVWADSWGPRMEHILRYSLLTLLQYPDATLLDIQPLLTDDEFRSHVISYTKDRHILNFWHGEYAAYTKGLRAEAIAPVLNKVGLFAASLPLRNTVGQKTRGFRMQEVMDSKKILIANLSKGELGEEASAIMGSILITSVQLAALYRARIEPHLRVPFFLYIDECHSFVTQSFADILAEARKYSLSLFLAHQYIEQLDPRIRTAIFGNVGTLITFRVGANDAEYLRREFHPIFTEEDLVNLPRFSMYLKLMIAGATSRPFSAVSLPLPPAPLDSSQEAIAHSRKQYSLPGSKLDSIKHASVAERHPRLFG